MMQPEPETIRTPEDIDPFLKLLGELNYSWTNTESLLIHMIGGLSQVKEDVAVVIFLTLNTTRARIDLVERLAKLPPVEDSQRDEILDFTRAMSRIAALRNHYNHCIYSIDPETGATKTILMRIADRRSEIKMGRTGELNEEALNEMRAAIQQLAELNAALWVFFKQNEFL